MNLRSAVIGSVLLHGGVLVAIGGGSFGTAPVRRPAAIVLAEIPVETPLDLDLPPLPLEAPSEPVVLPSMPDLQVPVPTEGDARYLDPDQPPGPPAEVIGISSVDGRRRGVEGARGGGGRIRGPANAPPAEPPAVEPVPEPPVPPPVFLPPSLERDRAPVYPPAVRRAGIEGTVRVRVEVEADGSVRGTTVAVSSGNAALDAAALEAAGGWVFLPATEDGRPVASVVYRWVSFRLTDGR